MNAIARIGTALCLLLAASCGDGSDTNNEVREDMVNEVRESIRDDRYCEITPLFFGPDGITSDTWNTSGLNDCPAADWEALDFEAIQQELGALTVRKNGPRHWLFDAGELHDREEAERRFFGNLEFKLVAHVQFNFTPPPPGNFIFEVAVRRDTAFLFYKDRPVYELLAPLGKRYVMQSYALIADPTLTLADLDGIGPGIGLPEGWQYRVRVLSEDLLVEDFQGLATAVRDALENTYQRAETLEYLPAGRVAMEVYNDSTMQSWTAFMSEQEAEELQVNLPWQKSDQIILADKSVYSRSPNAEVDGRIAQMAIAGFTFGYSELALCQPELHSSGLVVTGKNRKFHELTYSAERTIPYISNPGGENFVLVSNAPDALSEPGMLPAGWSHGEVALSDDWRIVFEDIVSTIETIDSTKIYQGPVSLPGTVVMPPQEDLGSSFTLKLLKNTGENPFTNLVYECDECSFAQHAAIEPPAGWSKGPTQVILPPGELRSTPCFNGVPGSMDFVPEIPGNEFKLIARSLNGRILEAGENGLMILSDIMRDTIFRFPLGSRVHELTDPEGNVFVLFGYEVESMDFTSPNFENADALANYPRPDGWTYSTRILDKDLVMESSGVVSILSIRAEAAASTWERR